MLLFKDIKQSYPVYILDRQNLTLTQGKVSQISFPHVDSTKVTFGNSNQPMVVDVTIVANSKTATYTIPENLGITEAGPNLVLSTERELLSREIEAMRSNAEVILNSVDKQKQIISKADELLSELNPSYKEKIQYEERFKSLESNMSDIKNMISRLFNNNNKQNINKQ